MTYSTAEIQAAKERLRIPDLWRLLGLPGEPGKSCRVPYREDRKPSFSIYDEGRRAHDFACGDNLDAIAFLGKVRGVTKGEAVRQFLELANGVPCEPLHERKELSRPQRPKPNLGALRPGLSSELRLLAEKRHLCFKAVEVAHDMGILRFGSVCGFNSWVITDESGFCAEGRPLKTNAYPALNDLPGRKAHTIKNSRKSWPVGILPVADYRGCFDLIALVEGGPDLLSVIHFALQQHRVGMLPVAVLGRGVCGHGLHPESLEHFRAKRVRLYPHDDQDGVSYQNTALLFNQLKRIDCEVDFFVFRGLKKDNGAAIKDLNDCTELAWQQSDKLEELFP